MSEQILMWIFGAIEAQLVLLFGAVFGLIVAQVKTKFAMNLFVGTLEDKIGKALHNDDNHLGIDALLDKLTHGDKSEKDYYDLKNHCNYIMNDRKASKDDRVGAATMAAICEFTLITKYGKTKKTV
jgi:hypothetical protein